MKKLQIADPKIEEMILLHSKKCGYNGIKNATGSWLENCLSTPSFEYAVISASNISDAEPLLQKYVQEYSNTLEIKTPYRNCLNLLKKIIDGLSPENVEIFRRGITFCPRNRIQDLFREGIAPLFFGAVPNGQIIVVQISYNYHKRTGFKRLMYTLAQYPNAITRDGLRHFSSLSKWNTLEPLDFFSVILGISQFLFYPYVTSTM